jgi:hypothetical protein
MPTHPAKEGSSVFLSSVANTAVTGEIIRTSGGIS